MNEAKCPQALDYQERRRKSGAPSSVRNDQGKLTRASPATFSTRAGRWCYVTLARGGRRVHNHFILHTKRNRPGLEAHIAYEREWCGAPAALATDPDSAQYYVVR
jgi:hypothetical protein